MIPETTLTTSPGSYYHRHIKPECEPTIGDCPKCSHESVFLFSDGLCSKCSGSNTHFPLMGTHSDEIPRTAKRIKSSWLIATEYNGSTSVLTVWIKATKSQLPKGRYYGMRIANVNPHHVGGLHSGNIPHPVTKRQLTTPTPIREAKARTWAQAERIKEQRVARRRRGLVDG